MANKSEVVTTFTNHVLLATGDLNGTFWEKAVIFICAHDENGAMGVILNRTMDDITFGDIIDSMEIEQTAPATKDPIVFSGGPVESNRGFILHSNDYHHETSINVSGTVSISATADILRAIAHGSGPSNLHFCLGYCGWGPGQLEEEVAENSWLLLKPDETILFDVPAAKRYAACMAQLGVDPNRMSSFPSGRA